MIVADERVGGKWLQSKDIEGKRYYTKSRSVWINMIKRCRGGERVQTIQPTYIGCHTSEEFKCFQKFTDWHTQQVGYKCVGYELDKDFLFPGNKLYSSENCVLIPKSLNSFLVSHAAKRGLYPQGVYWNKNAEKFISSISIGGILSYIGRFDCPQKAHESYVIAKEAEARRWAYRLKSGEFEVDERVTSVLESWKFH